jgi:hypothetical protein
MNQSRSPASGAPSLSGADSATASTWLGQNLSPGGVGGAEIEAGAIPTAGDEGAAALGEAEAAAITGPDGELLTPCSSVYQMERQTGAGVKAISHKPLFDVRWVF